MAFTGIQTPSDISAALSASVERGGLVLDEKDISPDFFDLKTGFAGQVLQQIDLGDHIGFLLQPLGAEGDTPASPLTFQQARDIEPGHDP